jgi:dihydrofolate synthase/folylpolyglutamate synthase
MNVGKSKSPESEYNKAVSYLLESLPMYQRIGGIAYKTDLLNAHRLDEYFGHQHRFFKTIHIAGTNGKGSVSHMLASVLQHAGYKTGLFTSPHLLDFRERVRVNGTMISKEFITEFTNRHKPIFEKIQPSFFEMSVFLAFAYFVQEQVDFAILETGLGGRLDTTNIITPEISVITNIGLDHTEILGNTLQDIAREKAGIIKEKVPIIIGESQPEIRSIYTTTADERGSAIYFADTYYNIDYQMKNMDGTVTSHFDTCYYWKLTQVSHDLKGFYQKKNIPAVLMTLALLEERETIYINRDAIHNGLKLVCASTGLMGRWQETGENPLVVCDTAHNTEGFSEIIKQLNETPHKSLHMVLGFVQDKDITAIARQLPKDALYYLCQTDVPRAMKAETLAVFFEKEKLKFQVFGNVADAFVAASKAAIQSDLIYIGGSTFIVADFLNWKKQMNSF